jgi:hypothetical protein
MDTLLAVSSDRLILPPRLQPGENLASQLYYKRKRTPVMKRSQAIALTALTATLAAGFTVYLLNRRKHAKRKDFVANAGYEMAYDIHFPVRYSKPGRTSRRNGSDQPSELPTSF